GAAIDERGIVIEVDAVAVEAGQDRVGNVGASAATQLDASTAFALADEGEVGQRWLGAWQRVEVELVVVRFDRTVAGAFALRDDHVLYLARPTEGPVEGVVLVTRQHDVLGIDRTAEEFDAVIGVVVHLDVVDHSAVTHALERDTIQLVGLGDVLAGILHHHVVQVAAVVCRIVAAVQTGGTFTLDLAQGGAFRATIDRRVAVDD